MRQTPLYPQILERFPLWLQAALRDRYLWAMLIVAVVVNLGLFAFLFIQFNQLPPFLPLHFGTAGDPDRIEPRGQIYSLPQIGLITVLGNFVLGALIYRREPLASYLLSGAAIVMQFLLWAAAIQIVRVVSA